MIAPLGAATIRRIILIIFAACMATGAVAAPRQPLPYAPGERLQFQLRWQKLVAGRATMEVLPGPDTLWTMRTIARSTGVLDALYPVRDTLVSVAGPGAGLPVRFEKRQHEGWYSRDSIHIFDQGRRTIRTNGKLLPAPGHIHDTLSLLYLVRAKRIGVGESVTATVYEGGKIYRVEMRVVRRATARVPAGAFSCLVVEPIVLTGGDEPQKKGRMWVWLSDDARRIPVLIQTAIPVGKITAELVSWQPGDGTISSSPSR